MITIAKYVVVRKFRDINHDHIYEIGDEYPKKGERATKARIESLSKGKNIYKKVYIEEVKEAPDDKE